MIMVDQELSFKNSEYYLQYFFIGMALHSERPRILYLLDGLMTLKMSNIDGNRALSMSSRPGPGRSLDPYAVDWARKCALHDLDHRKSTLSRGSRWGYTPLPF